MREDIRRSGSAKRNRHVPCPGEGARQRRPRGCSRVGVHAYVHTYATPVPGIQQPILTAKELLSHTFFEFRSSHSPSAFKYLGRSQFPFTDNVH